MARRRKFKKEFCEKAKQLASEGLIDVEIAKGLGICLDTYYRYKDDYPEFSEAVKKGKDIVDDKVESALLKRALGYEYKEIKTIVKPLKNGENDDKKKEKGKLEKIETTIKVIPPDVSAQMNWLKNRRPDKWRDKQDINLTGDITVDIEFEEDEEDQT